MLHSLCVFCGSGFGSRPDYSVAAKELGRLLAIRGITLVYGGANVGLMGALADACLESGGRVIGVMPQSLVDREVAHSGITQLHIVQTMHQRKAMMADLAEAFVALPGGIGTFEEFFEVMSWSQLGLQRKACGLLNIAGYYDGLLAMMDTAVGEGFLRREHREMLLSGPDPVSMLDRISVFQPPYVEKLIDRRQR